MQSQLKSRIMNRAKFNAGMVLFIKGLIKKIIFADQFALVFQALSGNDTVLGTWLYAISYAYSFNFDFLAIVIWRLVFQRCLVLILTST